jgi:hypothetical protein
MTEARKLIALRDRVAQKLGWQPRPLVDVDASYAEVCVHAPHDRAAHDAMLRRIRLEDKP